MKIKIGMRDISATILVLVADICLYMLIYVYRPNKKI